MNELEVIKVTNNDDNGEGSLRAAIEKSQKTPGGAYNIVFESKKNLLIYWEQDILRFH